MSNKKEKVKEILQSKSYCAFIHNHGTVFPGAKWVPCNRSYERFKGESVPVGSMPYEQFINSNFVKEVINGMENGQPHKFCEACFIPESKGLKSSRTINNQTLQKLITDEGLEDDFLNKWENYKTSGKISGSPYHWQLYLDNICQARCVMCDHTFSSSVEKDYEKLNLPVDFFSRLNSKEKIINDPVAIIDEIKKHAGSIRGLQILGGEPTVSQNCHDLCSWLVEHGYSKQIFLKINTNGIVLSQQWIDICKKFYRVQWSFSVDGTGDLNRYIRYPTPWDTLCKNLERAKKEKFFHYMVQSTTHAMNVHYLPELWTWVKEQGLHHMIPPPVESPNAIQIYTLTNKQREALEEKYSKFPEFKKEVGDYILGYLNARPQKDNKDLLYFISKLDTIRPFKFSDVNEFFKEEYLN